MKRTLIALFVVTLLVAVTAFGVARWLRCRSCAAPNVSLADELKLTDVQAAEVARIEAEFQKKLADCCAAHCAARAALAESLADPSKAAQHCARMCAAQTESEKAALDQVLKVLALLTPEQQQCYTALVQKQLSGECTMRLQPRAD
jgi:Spy/CpxP family protein refolding chaperone